VEHIKNRLLGHWGSDLGRTLLVHLNRLIKKYSLDLIYLAGPGHGAPASLANSYLEGVYSESIPTRARTRRGCRSLQAVLVSRRDWQPLHAGTPGSIHEGGSWGYSLSHGYGAAFDNPDLIVAVGGGRWRIGDGAAGDQLAR